MKARPCLSLAAISLLACFVCCGDYGSDHCGLSLPEEHVSLFAAHPEHVSRFRVESHDGRLELRLAFSSEVGAIPSLEVRPITPSAMESFQGRQSDSGEWIGHAVASCTDEFPCVAEFESVVTLPPAASNPIEGRMIVTVHLLECSLNPDRLYLAVEPQSSTR